MLEVLQDVGRTLDSIVMAGYTILSLILLFLLAATWIAYFYARCKSRKSKHM